MSEEKTEVQLLQEKLCLNKKHAAKVIDDAEMQKAMDFAEGYKKFLNDNKTEREVAAAIVEEAKKRGFVEFDKFAKYSADRKSTRLNPVTLESRMPSSA